MSAPPETVPDDLVVRGRGHGDTDAIHFFEQIVERPVSHRPELFRDTFRHPGVDIVNTREIDTLHPGEQSDVIQTVNTYTDHTYSDRHRSFPGFQVLIEMISCRGSGPHRPNPGFIRLRLLKTTGAVSPSCHHKNAGNRRTNPRNTTRKRQTAPKPCTAESREYHVIRVPRDEA